MKLTCQEKAELQIKIYDFIREEIGGLENYDQMSLSLMHVVEGYLVKINNDDLGDASLEAESNHE